MTFRNLFFAALCAAFVAGIVMSAVQYYRVVPLILAAETYEGQEPVAAHEHAEGTPAHTHEGTAPDAADGHAHDEDAWAPADGFERTAYTVLSNLLAAAGLALVLGAISVFANIPITLANGALWGLTGFLAVALAPALGLAPELPGMPAADLGARQVWWWGTVLATGAAALILAKSRSWLAIAAAAILVAAPHVIGAPQLVGEHASSVPANLANQFAATALATAAIFWLVLGMTFGRVNDYLQSRKAA